MFKAISFFVLLTFVSCGGNTPMKSFPFYNETNVLNSNTYSTQRPSLESMRFTLANKSELDYPSESMFEIELLSSYLVKRYYFNQFLNSRAPIRLSSYPLDTPGVLLRLPMGIQYKLHAETQLNFDMTLVDFPYQESQLQYVWFDTQEQKEVSNRRKLEIDTIGNYSTLNQLILDKKTLTSVAPANLRLIILALDKKNTSTKINFDGEITSFNRTEENFLKSSVDLLKRSDSFQPQAGVKPFWICANCSLNIENKLFVETSLEKIYEAASIGEIFKKDTQGHEASFTDLRFGDEVEINLTAHVQRFDIINRTHTGDHYLESIIDMNSGIGMGMGMKRSTRIVCQYSYQDISYRSVPVTFMEEEFLEALVIEIDNTKLTGLSYLNHYPHRFYRNQHGQLIFSYSNLADIRSIKVSFNPLKRVQDVHLRGDVVSANRSSCFDALGTPPFASYRSLVHGRNVRIQDVYTLNLSLKVYGAPRI